jgi:hypothetical protein
VIFCNNEFVDLDEIVPGTGFSKKQDESVKKKEPSPQQQDKSEPIKEEPQKKEAPKKSRRKKFLRRKNQRKIRGLQKRKFSQKREKEAKVPKFPEKQKKSKKKRKTCKAKISNDKKHPLRD